MKGEVVFCNGFRVRLTGEVRIIHGGKFHIGMFLEGPRAGTEAAIVYERAVKERC